MKTVLIIEDNENNMELISFILESAGYTTLRAYTGEEGCVKAINDKPDFIILDIQLPDIDGVEVIQRIRNHKNSRDIPAIAMTSYAMSGDREKLLLSGCDGYIEKPIDPDRILYQIQNVLTGAL